ncbi:hypothetical protein [Cryptosporangium aurantiacum]|uniref:Uncharacterized protein n=1 Tax=Cryptosporangium aurantiacum TaxID=134849 RepID=A0A1M7REI7_9ACTN|nr:hypothetical protein [Cryptosporangium aurantiacum]SHN44620.1 hypothetical protein SAMN05443668_110279 [Cryptosporangium aurantiacum]
MNYEQEATALYALPPAQFTTARDVRIAELKGEKQAALAGRLKLLRRPTVAAWCVNLLAGARREELRALVLLGPQLAEAQRRSDPGAIRALSAERRQRVAGLVAAATRLAGESYPRRGDQGPFELEQSVVADLEATLNAAVADAAVAERVLSGRMVRGEAYVGFGPLPEDPGPQVASEPAQEPIHEVAAARAESVVADRAVAAARCERDAVRRSRDVARHARDEAAAVLAEAERRLVDAERQLAGADRTLQRAEQHRLETSARLDAAERGPTGGDGPSGRRSSRSAARST